MNLTNYTKQCKDTIGKLKRVYLTKFVDYDESDITLLDSVVTAFPETIIYQFDCEGNYVQNSGIEAGNVSWSQEININLNKLYGQMNPKVFINSKFRLIGETNNGDILIFGLFNGLLCSLSNASGGDKEEFNGFALKFTGTEEEAANVIDLDLFYIFTESEYFNYTFNFNL